MEHSESLAKFGPAMVKAQGLLGPAIKNSTNPHFKSKFADLSAVVEAVEQVLPGNGLCILQGFEEHDGHPCLWTMLLHESGEWVKGRQRLIPTKQDPQGLASASTYARRYGIAAIMGLTQEDDDGNAASQSVPKQTFAKQDPAQDQLDAKLADWQAAMDGCSTEDELVLVWKKVPASLKPTLNEYKNERKFQLFQKGGN